jgi:hypothetical protein
MGVMENRNRWVMRDCWRGSNIERGRLESVSLGLDKVSAGWQSGDGIEMGRQAVHAL